ncbi:RhuM family protein [Corynebacterium pseudodiphtheriticum]|uniref:RhuM family protein n=1 Tax=Corynebacterium pseudodiphtheriticum TaxID=37637 RepID=UPI001EF6137D|nr:RhuM family protein [Corynebacterium pseudodiphtheriticum]MCG7253100.1 virulence RhuM family protein [Corynebacterium pseudodiphtheriticum]MDK4318499.1 RhuM family protein [Corynebacterium pseudodiphtheriticum]MDK4340351.1 RhuM family protein [Corynebacterium pseudodiphtheriticum]
MNEPEISNDGLGEFVIYTTDDGRVEIHLRLIDGSVWLTQKEIAELFDVSRSSVSEHVKHLVNSGELDRGEVVRKFRKEPGQSAHGRALDHYNLDAIMAVGFRVRGPRGAQFRRWATEVLREYLIKGFAMDDERLKDPRGADYFDELLERIRDIRSSEARLYLKIRDIIALAADYDPTSGKSRSIFATIQDKLHYAITGQTSSEILATRCDPQADNLGLTNFKGPRVRKGDIEIAKNYLEHAELDELNRLVTQFLEYAESQARRRKVVHLDDWVVKTDRFIEFNEYEPLSDHGRISRNQARDMVQERYQIYDAARTQGRNERFDAEILPQLQEIEQRILADRKRLSPRKLRD